MFGTQHIGTYVAVTFWLGRELFAVSWDQLQHTFTLSANERMEIKLATYSFKRNGNQSTIKSRVA